MDVKAVRIVIGIVLTLWTPAISSAQDATVTGTVIDATGGVIPGVSVTARHVASGNVFETVTDERGAFRIPVRIGVYDVTAELQGFGTVTRAGIQVLVGQSVTIAFELAPSVLQESITVTGDAPLVDMTSSSLVSNVDPRQLSELPVNGRNWIQLTMLASGSRSNDAAGDNTMPRANATTSKLNVDGQQVSAMNSAQGFGQPHYSRDAIAEFEFVSNRFDASQGRSSGVQVNAVTKAGTNIFSGTASGYFRHDSMIAEDFVAKRVLPYSNQQLSATFGGPITRDRIHFFAHYEYEREPTTFTYSTPVPAFNFDLKGNRTEPKAGVRMDFQFSAQTRLMVRSTTWQNKIPFDPRYTGGATKTPSSTESLTSKAYDAFATLTQVLGNRAVNEVRGGYARYGNYFVPYASFPGHPAAAANGAGAPQINFRGLRVGMDHSNAPQDLTQNNFSIRDDFTFSPRGHTIKFGAEYLHMFTNYFQCSSCMGIYDAGAGPLPSAETLEALFPDILDVSTWNLAPISPLVRSYSVGIGDFIQRSPRQVAAGWVQDDWSIASRLTLNLGVRYDVSFGAFAEDVAIPPLLEAGRSTDLNNIGPRAGFAYRVDDQTVVRGGWGAYFGDISDQVSSWTTRYGGREVVATVVNDGRPDFASNPWNGPAPTYEQVIATPGLRRSASQLATPDLVMPLSYQASIGVQRQFGSSLGVEVDYVRNSGRHELYTENINLTYNPATGTNYPWTDVSRAVYSGWGTIGAYKSEGWSDLDSLQLGVVKRYNQRWQGSATYTLSQIKDGTPSPAPFPLALDLGSEYGLAVTDQRHRAVMNGIWEVGGGFQLSGLYFYGSGMRLGTTYGSDLRQQGTSASNRLRPDGTIVPRNTFIGDPIHRVDLRLQRRFAIGNRTVDGIVEVFNAFNHVNYGSYTTQETSASYGRPTQNTNVSYQPRMVQLGFRVAF